MIRRADLPLLLLCLVFTAGIVVVGVVAEGFAETAEALVRLPIVREVAVDWKVNRDYVKGHHGYDEDD